MGGVQKSADEAAIAGTRPRRTAISVPSKLKNFILGDRNGRSIERKIDRAIPSSSYQRRIGSSSPSTKLCRALHPMEAPGRPRQGPYRLRHLPGRQCIASCTHLLELQPELLEAIAGHLDLRDLATLATTCHTATPLHATVIGTRIAALRQLTGRFARRARRAHRPAAKLPGEGRGRPR